MQDKLVNLSNPTNDERQLLSLTRAIRRQEMMGGKMIDQFASLWAMTAFSFYVYNLQNNGQRLLPLERAKSSMYIKVGLLTYGAFLAAKFFALGTISASSRGSN